MRLGARGGGMIRMYATTELVDISSDRAEQRHLAAEMDIEKRVQELREDRRRTLSVGVDDREQRRTDGVEPDVTKGGDGDRVARVDVVDRE